MLLRCISAVRADGNERAVGIADSVGVATLAEREKPNQELKDNLNAKLKELGDVRVSGRLTTTPRTMGKAAFVHLSDGVNRLQIYVRRDDVKGIANRSEPSAVADGLILAI